jgi:hypothetical protein
MDAAETGPTARGEVAMTCPIIIAAPQLIAAVLISVRFVGCTEDFDQFETGSGGSDLPSAATGDEQTFVTSENPRNSLFNSAPASCQAAISGDFRIGADTNADTSGEFFAGVIQNVAVNDRALEFKEIVSHYRVFASGYPQPEG